MLNARPGPTAVLSCLTFLQPFVLIFAGGPLIETTHGMLALAAGISRFPASPPMVEFAHLARVFARNSHSTGLQETS